MAEKQEGQYMIHGKPVVIYTLTDFAKEREARAEEEMKLCKKEVYVNGKNEWNGVQLPVCCYETLLNSIQEFQLFDWDPQVKGPLDAFHFNFFAYGRMETELNRLRTHLSQNTTFPDIEPLAGYTLHGYIGSGKDQVDKMDPNIFPKGPFPAQADSLGLVERFLRTIQILNRLPDEDARLEVIRNRVPKAEVLFRDILRIIREDKTVFPYLFLSVNRQWNQIYVDISSIYMLVNKLLGPNGEMYMIIVSTPTHLNWQYRSRNKNGIEEEHDVNYYFQKAIYMDVFGNMIYGILGGNQAYGPQVEESLLVRDMLKHTFPLFADIKVMSLSDLDFIEKQKKDIQDWRKLNQNMQHKVNQSHFKLIDKVGDVVSQNVGTLYKVIDGKIIQNEEAKKQITFETPIVEPTLFKVVDATEQQEKEIRVARVEKEKRIMDKVLPLPKSVPLARGAQVYVGNSRMSEKEKQEKKPAPIKSTTDGVNVRRVGSTFKVSLKKK